MTQSKFGKLNWRDALHSLIIMFISTLLGTIGQGIEAWIANDFIGFPITLVNLIFAAKVSLGLSLSYLIKQFMQNEQGTLGKVKTQPPLSIETSDEGGGGDTGGENPLKPPPTTPQP